jgi:hypothetical protein
MAGTKRRQRFVDRNVQGAILVRTAIYWLLCMVTVTLAVLCWRVFSGPPRLFYTHMEEMWSQYAPVAISSLLLLPIIMIDAVALTHRFAGPMIRLRKAMARLADGEPVERIEFREKDFWQDFAEEFNRLAARVQSSQRTGSVTRPGQGLVQHNEAKREAITEAVAR